MITPLAAAWGLDSSSQASMYNYQSDLYLLAVDTSSGVPVNYLAPPRPLIKGQLGRHYKSLAGTVMSAPHCVGPLVR